MLFIIGILAQLCWLIVTADVETFFIKNEIVPDVLDEPPTKPFTIAYEGKSVQLGEEWTPTATIPIPTVKWDFESSAFYTVIMIDIDPPTRAKANFREFVHWLVVNIPGNDISQGQTTAEYTPTAPPIDGGIHRVVFLVYKQPEKLTFDEPYAGNRSLDGRFYFSQRKFSAKYNMGAPIAGNVFFSQYDDYVPIIYQEFMNNMSE